MKDKRFIALALLLVVASTLLLVLDNPALAEECTGGSCDPLPTQSRGCDKPGGNPHCPTPLPGETAIPEETSAPERTPTPGVSTPPDGNDPPGVSTPAAIQQPLFYDNSCTVCMHPSEIALNEALAEEALARAGFFRELAKQVGLGNVPEITVGD